VCFNGVALAFFIGRLRQDSRHCATLVVIPFWTNC
jgi:hypothetical protein